MDVLIITSTFPRSRDDNQVPWLAQLVLRLKKRGIHPTVYAPGYKGLHDHIYFGISVIRFRYAPRTAEILTHEEGAIFKLREKPWLYSVVFFYLIFGVIGLFRLKRRFKFDVIHVHWPFPNGLFGIVAKRLFGAKLILSFHGAEFTLMRRIPFGLILLRFILKNADRVVANSLFTKGMIQSVVPIDVSVIPFSSALSVRGILSKRHPQGSTFRILFVGRLIERKGVSYLVDAISLLRKRDISVDVDIVGNGPLYPKIVEQIRRLHLAQYVRLHGEVDTERLARYYQKSNVFILPAIVDQWGDTEGLGVVLIEAMSFGIPVIASSVGGIPSVIKHNKNGLLVPEKNAEAIAETIEKLVHNPNLRRRLGENGLQFARRNYNWDSIIEKTINLY